MPPIFRALRSDDDHTNRFNELGTYGAAMVAGWMNSIERLWLACLGVLCAAGLTACADTTGTTRPGSASSHHCAQVDGADSGLAQGSASCDAKALGGTGNRSAARADGERSQARAVAGSLDLFDNGKADSYIASDNNASAAIAARGGRALARSGVNSRGTKGVGGNSAVSRAAGAGAVADSSAANGNKNAATSIAELCTDPTGEACAFSVAGGGDNNIAHATSHGPGSKAQAGALDGSRNKSVSSGSDGGRAFSNAQGGDDNSADSFATGDGAFASSQATGGGSVALSRADGAKSAANASAEGGGNARATADGGAQASATAIGAGFKAVAVASGPGTSASATHDADTDTGNCSGPGVAFAMTGGTFHCMQGF